MKTARIRLFTRWTMVLITALSVASCGGGGHEDHAVATVVEANRSVTDNAFTATLTGVQQVPPNASLAIGAGTVMIDANTRLLRATVTTAGIAATAANIHESPPGMSGPIVFLLSEASPGSGIWTTEAPLTDAQLNTLRNGGYYFNVQSAANPGDDIRGQILPRLTTPLESGAIGAGSTAAGTTTATVFKNALTGTQEVPPAATSATAIGTAAIDSVAKTVAVAVDTIGIAATEVHVHEGVPGQNGPIVFSLTQVPGSGIWFAKTGVNDAQLNAIMTGNYYFDVHSTAFANGELRGQIAQLHRRKHLSDCRFGGFGFDDCTFDGAGFFIGLGFGGIEDDGFGSDGAGFDGFGIGNGGTGNAAIGGGATGFDTPAPGFFF